MRADERREAADRARGTGDPLVLLHGWGLHGGIWSGLLPELAGFGERLTPDLPGHGASPCPGDEIGLEALADRLAPGVPEGAAVLGWSLGAMVALTLARRHPERVSRLVLVAATPRFTLSEDWDWGIDDAVFDGFARDLAKDYRQTLTRFLSLQVRGGTASRSTLRRLRAMLFARGEPSPRALAAGLEILRRADLRPWVGQLDVPTLVIAGLKDRLVPPGASLWLAAAMPRARLVGLPGAAHAPFLSHRADFLRALAEAGGAEGPAA